MTRNLRQMLAVAGLMLIQGVPGMAHAEDAAPKPATRAQQLMGDVAPSWRN
jgi:hypothetical protein